ncbi:dolichyl-phosphate beta-glucosyltransferase [Yamadazyma tenuis]|uniref:dolichyl-phosphate beta-glucosyltransferase n=1 Tax=Candida tenuis (strain ATCC 10573 / BCRC 21748 / CBS 615 / JCM 9827 / NBRC 10315 / NRRL Y-1498 / VKM Y-70) TaxID=590646 RepID=G3B8X1_CANTC|nr:dolichyl-phosphate beta-glucosyltransferase [Yamadazyma tenuis ATCC 10573]EGV61798.1 dolichyl-phosphate beta-glucosyltransferase [Yamadazyma tenuis ATCC 10573]WEJ93023.1 dolichyl-phosphate beta-glucosyltransferase [Yamadazyma tenuis]
METTTLFLVAAAVITILVMVYSTALFFAHSPRLPTPSELKYRTNDANNQHYDLPTRIDPAAEYVDHGVKLTVVVPCYNETKRLGNMFEECVEYFKTHDLTYEILIIDDESKDGTPDYALSLARKYELKPHTVKVVELTKNRGKGGAVTHGMLHASGEYVLFADADGATKFGDSEHLLEYLKAHTNPYGSIAIGSRAHMVNTEAVVKRSFIRNLLMYGLHTLVYVFGIHGVKDTQCGFKMFDFNSIKRIFPHMHTERWIFDVEILLLASYQGIDMKELPVNWQEIDGSKIDLVKDSINMAIDLVVTRVSYILGIYKLNMNGHSKTI